MESAGPYSLGLREPANPALQEAPPQFPSSSASSPGPAGTAKATAGLGGKGRATLAPFHGAIQLLKNLRANIAGAQVDIARSDSDVEASESARSARVLWAGIVALWMLIGLTWTLNYYFFAGHYVKIFTVPPTLGQMLVWELPYWLLWAALSPMIFWLAERFPLERGRSPQNLAIHAVSCILLSIVHRGLYLAVGWLLQVAEYERLSSLPHVFQYLFFFNLPNGFMSYGTFLLVSYLVVYHKRYRGQELRASRLETRLAQTRLQATSAELRALKMQLQPHFLFNTLESISSLLEDDKEAADRMLCRLGDLLRKTTEGAGAQMVSLEEELECLQCYLDIERVRFEERLSVDVQIEPAALDAMVPNLILQPLVENAVKYAVAPSPAPSLITIRASARDGALRIEVADNGKTLGPAAIQAGLKEGLGLSNTRARLAQLYGGAHQFEISPVPGGGLRVTLEMPLDVTGVESVGRD